MEQQARVRIVLDREDKTYFAGQTIKGQIYINLTKRVKIRAIKVQISGKGKCKWIEILRKNSNNDTARSLFYSSKEIYAHCENPLAAFEPRGVELASGVHNFGFAVPLDIILPSSFKGSHGSIKYKLRVLIQRPWTFDDRHIIPITVVKNMPLPECIRLNPITLQKQITKTISLFGSRPITMVAFLPADYAIRGDAMRVCVTVTNNSTTNVEKVKFTVLQHIWYYSHVPLRIKKTEIVPVLTKETGAVHKKSERTFAHELLIPGTLQPSDDCLSGVINILYELRVEAVLRGFFKNLVLNLPFKLFSNDLATEPTPPPPVGSVRQASDADSDCSISSDVVHTLFDSPSHSSQYSESSSCVSSRTNSSGTTLSPAVGGQELSYASGSGSSLHYESPAARAGSMRSNVPYVPYCSSPLMVNSYPPPGVGATALPPLYPAGGIMSYGSDDTDHVELYAAAAGSSRSPRRNDTAATSSNSYRNATGVSFLRGHQHPGALELPPSYEELFGSASAPLESPK